jgi:hypothetical protein
VERGWRGAVGRARVVVVPIWTGKGKTFASDMLLCLKRIAGGVLCVLMASTPLRADNMQVDTGRYDETLSLRCCATSGPAITPEVAAEQARL